MYQTLHTHLEDQILTITINRPDKMNALNATVVDELSQAVEVVYKDPGIRSAIITGAGENAFVAGADITEFASLDDQGATEHSRRVQEQLFNRIAHCPKPFAAAVNGYALGGGCELAMACHFRLASETARFGQPEVGLGLIPGYGGTQRLVQLVGRGRALEILLTGDTIRAEEAHRIGLVNHVVPQFALMDLTRDLLIKIQTRAPLAVSAAIACVNAALDKKLDGFETESCAFGKCFSTADMREGTQAFLEKRPPVFTGA